MSSDLYLQANKIWNDLSHGKTQHQLQLEADVYRRLLNYFMAGDYYYFIFNVRDVEFELLSEELYKVLGHNPEGMTVGEFISLIHPEDQPYFLANEEKATKFVNTLRNDQVPNYKISYDYRMKKKNGEYLRILHQTIAITHDESNAVIRTFGVHTDISHLKLHGAPTLSFIGLNGEPSYLNIDSGDDVRTLSAGLTQREFEVMRHLTIGMSSEEIGKLLHISKHTVDVHRRNVLQKTNCKNTVQLTRHAVSRGWV